jgi:hypothetical protein
LIKLKIFWLSKILKISYNLEWREYYSTGGSSIEDRSRCSEAALPEQVRHQLRLSKGTCEHEGSKVATSVRCSHHRAQATMNKRAGGWGTGSHQAPVEEAPMHHPPCHVSQWWPWSFPYSRKKQLESTRGLSTSTNCPSQSQEASYLQQHSCMKIRVADAVQVLVCSSICCSSWFQGGHFEIASCSLPSMLQMHCNNWHQSAIGCWYCKQNIRRQDASALQITPFQKKRNQKICKDHGYDTHIR